MQPLPVSQLHWCKPGVDHHEEDARQGEGDGEEGGFEATEAVVWRRGMITGHVLSNYSILNAATLLLSGVCILVIRTSNG